MDTGYIPGRSEISKPTFQLLELQASRSNLMLFICVQKVILK